MAAEAERGARSGGGGGKGEGPGGGGLPGLLPSSGGTEGGPGAVAGAEGTRAQGARRPLRSLRPGLETPNAPTAQRPARSPPTAAPRPPPTPAQGAPERTGALRRPLLQPACPPAPSSLRAAPLLLAGLPPGESSATNSFDDWEPSRPPGRFPGASGRDPPPQGGLLLLGRAPSHVGRAATAPAPRPLTRPPAPRPASRRSEGLRRSLWAAASWDWGRAAAGRKGRGRPRPALQPVGAGLGSALQEGRRAVRSGAQPSRGGEGPPVPLARASRTLGRPSACAQRRRRCAPPPPARRG